MGSTWRRSPEERFWGRVAIGGPNDCWEWTSSWQGQHGKVWRFGRCIGAHVYSWILAHGELPDGSWVLHRCDNPPCVNPNHLFLGTSEDNQRDMAAKGRWVNQYGRGVMP